MNEEWTEEDLERWAGDYRRGGFSPREIGRIVYWLNRADQNFSNIPRPTRRTVVIEFGRPIRIFHDNLVKWGFRFRVDGDELLVTRPKDVDVPPVLWDEIAKRKPQLLALLKGELADGKQGSLLG